MIFRKSTGNSLGITPESFLQITKIRGIFQG